LPGKTLRLHGVAKRYLRWAETPGFAFDLEKQHPTFGEDDQIGEPSMHAHADEDCLACPGAPVI